MSTYWDTSAIINALVSPRVSLRLTEGEHHTRLHAFYEFFAVMTGRGILAKTADGTMARITLSPENATAWLRQFSTKLKLADVTVESTLDAFDLAASKGVMGGRVYDYGHALAAEGARCDKLLTRNTNDFAGLSQTIELEWP